LLFVGQVSSVFESNRAPLLFHSARYHKLGKVV
jgi:hypothetical protein